MKGDTNDLPNVYRTKETCIFILTSTEKRPEQTNDSLSLLLLLQFEICKSETPI